MSWITDKAINRVFNAFKRNKNNIYKEDIEALKTLNESLVDYQKEFINDNKLFAKLLSIQLMQNLRYYGSIEMAIKVSKEDIKKPIDYNLQILHIELNNFELQNYFKSIGLKNYKSLSELEDNKIIINENQKEITKKVLHSWSYENVEKSFYNTANEMIKNIENYE